ncbi:cation:dicarboxylate symporter family transporter [Chryseobacterium sp. JUb7]|uniref:cation:dicarboxylate symporter family transporter n=1 Tax=Chryseobacterium sp. JUb7 TaxID=2940599 RepID=UPI0021686D24|nr:cation:dicarboxylase symporter family transporter [Chryseobacterium sp. JUb7]MCS3530531.1 aerobic C4-dicarboxylate transport protein [Chryseobacterium sp. JUb7]
MSPFQTKKTFTGKYLRNLTLYVFIAIIGGVISGHYLPEFSKKLELINFYFFTILEALILPVIFIAIIYGILNLFETKNSKKIILHTAVYFISITSLSIILGLSLGFLIKPGADTGIDLTKIHSTIPKRFEFASGSPDFFSLYNSRYSIFLLISIIIGIIAGKLKSKKLTHILNSGMELFYVVIKYLYIVLPIIIFCNIAYGISVYGINTLLPLSKIVATVYLASLIFIFGILGSLCHFYQLNFREFLISIKDEIILVMTTSSSKTAFPMIFEKLESQGYAKKVIRFLIPLGYNFNLAGACIYISASCMFLVQFYNISMDLQDYFILFLIISITSKTASGVPGSGFLALIFTLEKFGKIPLTDIALLYSVDRFMNEARSVTNFIGIAVSAAIISKLHPLQEDE